MARRFVEIELEGEKPAPPPVSQKEAAIMAANQGLYFDFYDEAEGIYGGINRLLQGDTNVSDAYRQRRDQFRAKDVAAQQQYPDTYLASKTSAAIVPSLIAAPFTGGASASASLPYASTALGRVLTAARTAAPYGALSGYGASEGDWQDQFASTVLGGGAAAVTGGLLQGGVEGVRAGVNRLLPGSAGRAAQRNITRSLVDDAVTPDDLRSRAASMQTLGKGDVATLADLGGRKTQDTITALGQSPGRAYNVMSGLFAPRQQGQNLRIDSDIDEAFGARGNFYQKIDNLIAARDKASAAAYKQAYDAPVDYNDEIIGGLLNRTPREAFSRAQKVADIRGYNQNVEKLSKGGSSLTTQGIDYIKRGLDDYVGSQYAAGRPEVGRAARDLRSDLLARVDELNPAYATARKEFAGPTQALEYMEEGAKFLNKSPQQIRYDMAEIGGGNVPFYQAGAQKQLQDTISRVSDTADAAKRIGNIQARRENIASVLQDTTKAQRFSDQLAAESQMFETAAALDRGKNTGLGVGRLAQVEGTPISELGSSRYLVTRALERLTQDPERLAGINAMTAERLMTPVGSPDFEKAAALYEGDLTRLLRQLIAARGLGASTGRAVGGVPSDVIEAR